MQEILLANNKGAVLIDDGDYELVSRYKWALNKDPNTAYAMTNIKKQSGWSCLLMHRLIMNPPKEMEIDHRDGNGLNNQRSNLRICTHRQNGMNRKLQGGSSQHKGVCWSKNSRKWKVYITIDSTHIHLGYYDDEIEAARAYNKKAKILFGDFAKLNEVT